MSKDRNYHRLVSNVRWQTLSREMKLKANYECELCHVVTHRLAVHHIKPVESGKTYEEMERLCFDRSNLQVLCYSCHRDVHISMQGTGKMGHQRAEAQRIERYECARVKVDFAALPTLD